MQVEVCWLVKFGQIVQSQSMVSLLVTQALQRTLQEGPFVLL